MRHSQLIHQAVPARLPPGTLVAGHVVDGWVRDGGMASLYRGHHPEQGTRVAIKVQMHGGARHAELCARFEREVALMERLVGVPQVVQALGQDRLPDGRRLVIMEWIEGLNLEELLDELRNADTPLEIDRACRLLADVAWGLEAIHRRGVVHRDLKPSNIMVETVDPVQEQARLVDFGIAAEPQGSTGTDLTATGMAMGTSGYMAPEQRLGMPATPAFDVYALGVVLFEAVTGHCVPPDGLVLERLPTLQTLRPGIPADLARLVHHCLQVDPKARPIRAADVAQRLSDLHDRRDGGFGGTIGARAYVAPAACIDPASPGPTASWPRATVRGGLAIVGGMMAMVVTGVFGAGPTPAPARLELEKVHNIAVSSAVSPPPGDAGAIREPQHYKKVPKVEPQAKESRSAGRIKPRNRQPRRTKPPVGSVAQADRCPGVRRAAHRAKVQRDWRGVLRLTDRNQCWPQQNERTTLRVMALAEVEHYDVCVQEGAGSSDPVVARVTKVCRRKQRMQK